MLLRAIFKRYSKLIVSHFASFNYCFHSVLDIIYKMSEIEDAIQFLVDHGKADVALKIKEFFDLHSSKDQV